MLKVLKPIMFQMLLQLQCVISPKWFSCFPHGNIPLFKFFKWNPFFPFGFRNSVGNRGRGKVFCLQILHSYAPPWHITRRGLVVLEMTLPLAM